MASVKRIARRVENQYGNKLAKMLGVAQADVRFRVGAAGGGTYTNGTRITIDPRMVSRGRDTKGMIVHELTHAYEQSQGVAGKKVEALADAARSRLGLGGGEGYSSKYEDKLAQLNRGAFRRVAQGQAGGNVAEYRGSSTGSSRMKGPNASSNGQGANKVPGSRSGAGQGGAKALPALTPAQNASYYDQLAASYAGYQNTLMGLRQERVGLRTAFKTERTAIRGELIGNLSGIQNSNIERGTLAGSAAMQEEIGARADAETQRSAAKNEMLQGLAYNRISQSQAAVDYAMQRATLESQKLAQQQEQLANQLENNTIQGGLEKLLNATNDSNASRSGAGGGDKPAVNPPNQKPPNFPGSENDWRKLGRDEKFRYTMAATYLRTPPPTNTRGAF